MNGNDKMKFQRFELMKLLDTLLEQQPTTIEFNCKVSMARQTLIALNFELGIDTMK